MPSQYLSTVKPRSEIIGPSETVTLKAMFRGPDGNPADLDSFPTVTIVQPSGNVVLGPTSAGVYKISTGQFGFDYQVGLAPILGVWTDIWQASINGNYTGGSFNFVVHNFGQQPSLNTDGYHHLGDYVGTNLSQGSIKNVNILLRMLKRRLNSEGKKVSKDSFGNKIYVDCDIFSIEELFTFLCYSLEYFNLIPTFTFFQWDDTEFFKIYGAIIVQGALIHALASRIPIERANSLNLSDNGISYTAQDIADTLQNQYTTEWQYYQENLKAVKANMKSAPLGLGTVSGSLGTNRTIYRNLSNMRARRII